MSFWNCPIYNYGEKDYIQKRLDQNDRRFTKYDENFEFRNLRIFQINIIEKKEVIEPIYNGLKRYDNIFPNLSHDIYSGYYWMEISNKHGNKKESVKFLKSHLNADKVVAFGDNLNDIPMFDVSDEKIAVSNAMDALKKLSTEIIGHNDEDAVALYLCSKLCALITRRKIVSHKK